MLSQIINCCGEIHPNNQICTKCSARITKCTELVDNSQITIMQYVELIRTILAKGNKVRY